MFFSFSLLTTTVDDSPAQILPSAAGIARLSEEEKQFVPPRQSHETELNGSASLSNLSHC
jgi:hypothetical protein